jgi:hypothetical protein
MLVRGLLAYNLGENLDDLQTMVTPSDDFSTSAVVDDDVGSVWTCNFMDIQLQVLSSFTSLATTVKCVTSFSSPPPPPPSKSQNIVIAKVKTFKNM